MDECNWDPGAGTMMSMINRRTISALALSGVLALGAGGAAQAKHGADDGPAHHVGDDNGKRHGGRGADDNAHKSSRHERHRRHRHDDDGPNHS